RHVMVAVASGAHPAGAHVWRRRGRHDVRALRYHPYGRRRRRSAALHYSWPRSRGGAPSQLPWHALHTALVRRGLFSCVAGKLSQRYLAQPLEQKIPRRDGRWIVIGIAGANAARRGLDQKIRREMQEKRN